MKTLVLYTPATSNGVRGTCAVEFVAEKFTVTSVQIGVGRVEFVGGPSAGTVLYPGMFPFLVTG